MSNLVSKRLIVAMTGATGLLYGVRLLTLLKKNQSIEIHCIISKAARLTMKYEYEQSIQNIYAQADHVYSPTDIGASIASGSYRTDGMIILPASAKTLAEIANGLGENLIARAADVVLKERRRLLVCLRETPLNLIHINNMKQVTLAGGIIMPMVNAFYHHPKTIDNLIDEFVARALSVFDIVLPRMKEWQPK